MTVADLAEKYASCLTALINVRVTMTINDDGTVTREKAKGIKQMTLTVPELESHIEKMTAQIRNLLAM